MIFAQYPSLTRKLQVNFRDTYPPPPLIHDNNLHAHTDHRALNIKYSLNQFWTPRANAYKISLRGYHAPEVYMRVPLRSFLLLLFLQRLLNVSDLLFQACDSVPALYIFLGEFFLLCV